MKAYLAWPVKLKTDLQEEFHVTLKYLGDVTKLLCCQGDFPVALLAEEIDRRLHGQLTKLDLSLAKWVPERFNRSTHVMVLEDLHPALTWTHESVKSLRDDDYPTWRPHITVSLPRWVCYTRQNLKLQDCVESVGPLTLFVRAVGEDFKARARFVG